MKQLLDEINEANKKVQEVQSEIRIVSHQMIEINQNLIELLKKVEKIEKQIYDYASDKKGLQNAENLKIFFKEYKVHALEDQASNLEKNFLETFELLTRKESIIDKIKINPSTFDVSLHDSSGRVISKNRLSEGEKQIYAISVMKSLSVTSGKNIPVIVDTPLARLDSRHRDKLVKNYFPNASHQVVLLSTDTEIDKDYYELIKDKTINSYHINFDDKTHASEIKDGYFWS